MRIQLAELLEKQGKLQEAAIGQIEKGVHLNFPRIVRPLKCPVETDIQEEGGEGVQLRRGSLDDQLQGGGGDGSEKPQQ